VLEPAFPAGIITLTLSATATTDTAAITALIRLPHWPPTRHEAVARGATRPTRGRPRVDRVGSACLIDSDAEPAALGGGAWSLSGQ
jgi:hypothetical protein